MENNTNNNEEKVDDIEKALKNIENELKETDRIINEDRLNESLESVKQLNITDSVRKEKYNSEEEQETERVEGLETIESEESVDKVGVSEVEEMEHEYSEGTEMMKENEREESEETEMVKENESEESEETERVKDNECEELEETERVKDNQFADAEDVEVIEENKNEELEDIEKTDSSEFDKPKENEGLEEIDIDDIKIEEIDIEQIKRELEAQNFSEERIEEELALLEKNILKQSDIFETELLLDAIIRDQELLDGINNHTSQEVKSVTGILPSVNENSSVMPGVAGENDGALNQGTLPNVVVTNGTKVKKKTYNKAMSKVLVAVTAVFFSLIIYIVYYVMFESKDKLNNEYNERSLLLEETVVRGKILSADQKILAQTIKEGDEWIRHYPYGSLFAHSVGRYSKGKTGIELGNDFTLVTTKDTTIDKIINDVNNEKSLGNNIVTTLDYNLQKVASDALGTKKGAVVVIEPSTGKILSMVSKPSYDPNYIEKNWSVLSNADNSKNSLLNRATMGLYSPGSTFKIVTALSYMRNRDADEFLYTCSGIDNFNGYNMSCYNNKRHRSQNLISAFANSCNGAFATIGIELGKAALMKTANDLLFNKTIDYEYGYAKSSFALEVKDDETMVAQTSIGQGNTQITPFHNALIVSAIANNGVLMEPYMVDSVIDGDEVVIDKRQPKRVKTLLSTPEARYLTDMMQEVVNVGTATDLKSKEYDVAGKTGSAEYGNNGKSHAWFVGFATCNERTIALSILVEDGGTGTTSAVPIAKAIFENYF